MNFFGIFKKVVRTSFNKLGFDIMRIQNNPHETLLGIKYLPIKTIIDVGANEGQWAKYIMEIFPHANLHCFEPILEPYEKLKQWANTKYSGKVSVYNIALGEKEEETEMFLHSEHTTSSSLLKTTEICEGYYPFTKTQKRIPVKMVTLDSWVKNLSTPLTKEILIKLDVQGYEDRVIKGGFETFKKARACIIEICLDRLYDGQPDFISITNLLFDLGFKYAGNLNQSFANDGHVIFIDAVFVRK